MLLSNNGFTPRNYPRQILKINNIKTYLGLTAQEDARLNYALAKGFTGLQFYGLYGVLGGGNNPNTGNPYESDLAAFITKARTAPYNFKTIGAILGSGNAGFINALAYNSSHPAISRFNDFNKENEFWNGFRVDFTVLNAVVGSTYTITLNGTPYTHIGVLGDSTTTIATALAVLCAASGLVVSSTGNIVKIKDTSSIYSSFTYSTTGNIDSEEINETYTDWINSLIWLNANIGTNGTISAYVANSSNNWGVTEAEQMCAVLDYYEGTNYTTTPNALQNSYRNNQLVNIAQGAANIGKVQKHYPIFSAESLTNPTPCGEATFMGTYLQTNGIVTANTTWKAQYDADPIPNKSNLSWSGYSYFSYNCLSLYVP